MTAELEKIRGEIEELRRVTYEHHWRLQTLEASLRKRVVVSEARASLLAEGRAARPPGCVSRSQYGEDAVIWEILGGPVNGRFFEAGAIDGLQLSVTAILEAIGWSGVLVEPVPQQAAACRVARLASTVVEAALGAPGHPARVPFLHVRGAEAFSGLSPDGPHLQLAEDQGGTPEKIEVPMTTIDAALEQAGASDWESFDAAVLDLEGGEPEALRGFDLDRWRPRLLMIEDHNRSSQSPVAQQMESSDYRLVGTLRINRVYVRNDEPLLIERARGIHWL